LSVAEERGHYGYLLGNSTIDFPGKIDDYVEARVGIETERGIENA
jgi:hypothetical protein